MLHSLVHVTIEYVFASLLGTSSLYPHSLGLLLGTPTIRENVREKCWQSVLRQANDTLWCYILVEC